MSSVVTAVFTATIGLLVNKAAERLKEGDVTDQKFRDLIVDKIDKIKSKLDGLARKDLLASISFFKEGIEFLYGVFDKVRSRSKHGAVTAHVQTAAGTASAEAFSLSKQMRKLELTGLDESASRALISAKERFKDARRKATEAFNNEALELCDRVLAMQYRVMATILETVDNPKDALAACRVCIEELHQVPAVKECFKVELEKQFWARFSKVERRTIISTVCHLNRVIYDVTLLFCFAKEWPGVKIREENVDTLHDERVARVLQKQGMEHCCVRPWSFGQEGEEKDKLKNPLGITTNSHGQFIIADDGDKSVKVFDSNGKFHLRFNPQTDDADTKLDILDVATDVESNTYVLVRLRKPGAEESEWEVQMYTETAGQLNRFPVRRESWGWRLTVSGSKVLVSNRSVVDVYEQSGEFVCSFGEGEIKGAGDTTAANDDRVMVMDWGDSSVRLFTVEGQQLYKFNINSNIEGDEYYRLSCHPAGEHVVVAGYEIETARPRVAIFTTSGEFVRMIQLDEEKVFKISGITVTMEGHISVVFIDKHVKPKVIVV